jgi:hypothetical protein
MHVAGEAWWADSGQVERSDFKVNTMIMKS